MTNSRMATGKTVKQLIEEQEFMRNLMELGDRPEAKRFSKYDYFIQKLEAGKGGILSTLNSLDPWGWQFIHESKDNSF